METNAITPQNKNENIKESYNQERIFKVIVIGDSNVGKTSLTYRFCEGKFLDSPEATIGVDFRSKILWLNDEKITLQLWDTAGQERFRKTMVRHYYRNANAVVFVYDVTNATSFDSLKKWIAEVDMYCSSEVPRILVGNKCDHPSSITTIDAQTFADHYNMPLFETSARLDSEYDNVESIFLTLAHKLKNQKPFFISKIEGTKKSELSSNASSCC